MTFVIRVRAFSRPPSRKAVRRAAGPVLALAVLGSVSGCGSQLDPGIAVKVGSQSYSLTQLDEDTSALCAVLQSSDRMIGSGYAMSSLRNSAAQSLAFIALGDELGRKYSVSASADFRSAEQSAQTQVAAADEADRDRALPIFTAQNYFVDVARQIGAKQLAAAGQKSDDDTALTAGLAVAAKDAADIGIEMSPQLSQITLTTQKLDLTSQETSVAVSDFAQAAAAEEPTDDYIASLPANQKCMPKAS